MHDRIDLRWILATTVVVAVAAAGTAATMREIGRSHQSPELSQEASALSDNAGHPCGTSRTGSTVPRLGAHRQPTSRHFSPKLFRRRWTVGFQPARCCVRQRMTMRRRGVRSGRQGRRRPTAADRARWRRHDSGGIGARRIHCEQRAGFGRRAPTPQYYGRQSNARRRVIESGDAGRPAPLPLRRSRRHSARAAGHGQMPDSSPSAPPPALAMTPAAGIADPAPAVFVPVPSGPPSAAGRQSGRPRSSSGPEPFLRRRNRGR